MKITVQAKRVALSTRTRQAIQAYIGRAFARQQQQIASCAITIVPVRDGGQERLGCHIRLWSARLGSIGVREVGDTLRTAVQQAAIRAREVARRRLHKRRARARRVGRRQLQRPLVLLFDEP